MGSKIFYALGAALMMIAAAGVSVMNLRAEEAAEAATTQSQAVPFKSVKYRLDNWLIISKSALGRKNGEIWKEPALGEFLQSAKDQGCITVMTGANFGYGENRVCESRYDRRTNLWSQRDRPSVQDPIGNGITYEVVATNENEQVNLKIRATYRFFPSTGFPVSLTSAEPFSQDSLFQFKNAGAEAALRSDEGVWMDLGEVEPGTFVVSFSHVTPLNVDGWSLADLTRSFKRPSVDVKGKVRISGVRIDVPAWDLKADMKRQSGRHPQFQAVSQESDSMTWVAPGVQTIWENVLGVQIQKLKPVDFPLIEFRQPWLQFPGLKFSAYLSEDYRLMNLTMLPSKEVVDQEIQNLPMFPPDLPLSFKLRSPNPKTESRVFFKVEAIKP